MQAATWDEDCGLRICKGRCHGTRPLQNEHAHMQTIFLHDADSEKRSRPHLRDVRVALSPGKADPQESRSP